MTENWNIHATPIKEYLTGHVLVTDGAFGTYYAALMDTQELPELANRKNPEVVRNIHKEYIEAGARLIRTNTYASNTAMLQADLKDVKKNIRCAYELAVSAADGQAYVAGDIGPIPFDHAKGACAQRELPVEEEYIEICKTWLECGVQIILFETFSQLEELLPAIEYLKNQSDVFVIVQFAVNQYGYSEAGLSARRLFAQAAGNDGISAVGLNCGVGPGHMQQILSGLSFAPDKFITALPNAGYPQTVSNRMIFAADNKNYFTEKAVLMAETGVRIIGGCCGTTPDYIRRMAEKISRTEVVQPENRAIQEISRRDVRDTSFYAGKDRHEKLIAVELAPPVDSDDQKLMEAAHILEKSGVDVLTFPDSPSGRTRADSILMAEKVSKETGMCVMPHLCCRDKNAIAIRSQLLGAHINGINNFLVITGDPIPSMVRQSVKAVFNFDSIGLMNIISDMNEEQFVQSPLCFGGAINQNRLHLELETARVKKKMRTGASFFLTQPVFDLAGAKKLEYIKQETGARILCGIMPFVSLRNAVFMKNEMTGIEVSDEIIERYRGCTSKEDGEAVGVSIAREVIAMTEDFVDGYYFSFPFNRVYLLEKIIS